MDFFLLLLPCVECLSFFSFHFARKDGLALTARIEGEEQLSLGFAVPQFEQPSKASCFLILFTNRLLCLPSSLLRFDRTRRVEGGNEIEEGDFL